MRLCVRIDTKAALKAGKNYAGHKVMDFDPAELSPEERAMLALKTTEDRGNRPEADLYLIYAPGPVELLEATVDGLKAVLAESLKVRQAELAAREEAARAEAVRQEANVAKLLTTPAVELVERGYGARPWGVVWDLRRDEIDPRLVGKRAEARSEADRRNNEEERRDAEAKKLSEEKKAAAEAKKAAGIAALAEWVEQHGSELVRERRANGFQWIGLAEEEYADALVAGIGLAKAEIPDGYEHSDDDERKNPTLEEIRAMKRLRESIGDRGTVELRWLKYNPDEDNYEEESIGRCEIRVTVTCPTGREIDLDFLPPKDEVSPTVVRPAGGAD